MRVPPYALLAIAIVAEVIATSAMRASDGFSRLLPSMVVVLGYGVAFYCLSLTLRSIPVGIVYAIWSGAGIVLITLVALVLYRQVPDVPAIVGLGLIVAGVAVLNLFSKMQAHSAPAQAGSIAARNVNRLICSARSSSGLSHSPTPRS
ncbi:small multidrug resistance pump [Paraburkholderia sp. JPY158]|uniref:Small multidrug resistance pump n=2 Tax=Paraburkholderia atlantica TaxID=2654982 RepID=A0A7W8Q645_PARAM|nr:small multidrug resistance pump [Paraburkholderia atlantica]